MKTSLTSINTIAVVAGLLAAFGLSANAQLAHYYYSGGGASIINDQVGSANGTLHGAASLNAGALVTDGTGGGLVGGVPSNAMQLDPSAVSGISGAFTIFTWFQSAGNAFQSHLFDLSDGGTANMLACLAVDNWWPQYPPHAYTGIGGSYTDVWGNGYDNGQVIPDPPGYGSWTDDNLLHQLALSYDGATLTMYVDTQLAGSASLSGFDLSSLTTIGVAGGSPWAVGDRSFNGTTYALGILDQSISGAQVQSVYGLGKDATVSAINAAIIPEPSVLAFGSLGGLAVLLLRRRA